MTTAVPAAAAPQPERERVIVQLRDDVSTSGMRAAAVAAEEERRGARIRYRYRSVLSGFVAELPPDRVEALRRDPRIAAVTPDARASGAALQSDPTWGLDRLDQRDARADGQYAYDTSGRGVTVYVVDTGVRSTHSELAGRVRSGWDFVDADGDASDCHGHGTHVAGTIGGTRFGVAKQAEIVSLRVWGCNNAGWVSDMIAAIDWAVADRQGPAVINMSGGGGASPVMDEAVARATAAGVPVVVAAMNDATDACTRSPARAPSAVTVAATDSADRRASFSNVGSCVDVFAPGVNVQSSTAASDTSSASWNGTSMATPHVAGAVARYLETAPGASPAAVSAWLQSSATQGVVTDARSDRSGLLHVAPPAAVAVPGAPTQVASSTSGQTATITWQPPASTGGSAVTGYRVSRDGRDAGGGGPWSTLVAASARSHTFRNLVPGVGYTLTVQAVNAAGNGPGASTSVTVPVGALPGAPTSVAATQNDATRTATLKWQPPSATGGTAITGYRVSRDGVDAGGGGPWSRLLTGSARSVVFQNLARGATYTLTVQAVNASGNGVGAARQLTMARVHEAFTSSAASFQVVRGGTWRVANGRYLLSAPSAANLPNANLSVHTTPVPGDFVLTASGRTTSTANAFNDFSVVFGYADASNYWFANFAESNDGTHSGLFRVSRGVRTQVADIPGRISAGTTYPVRVERRGSALRVYRSGALVARAEVSTLGGDRVGFGSRNDGGAFDNLVVTR